MPALTEEAVRNATKAALPFIDSLNNSSKPHRLPTYWWVNSKEFADKLNCSSAKDVFKIVNPMMERWLILPPRNSTLYAQQPKTMFNVYIAFYAVVAFFSIAAMAITVSNHRTSMFYCVFMASGIVFGFTAFYHIPLAIYFLVGIVLAGSLLFTSMLAFFPYASSYAVKFYGSCVLSLYVCYVVRMLTSLPHAEYFFLVLVLPALLMTAVGSWLFFYTYSVFSVVACCVFFLSACVDYVLMDSVLTRFTLQMFTDINVTVPCWQHWLLAFGFLFVACCVYIVVFCAAGHRIHEGLLYKYVESRYHKNSLNTMYLQTGIQAPKGRLI